MDGLKRRLQREPTSGERWLLQYGLCTTCNSPRVPEGLGVIVCSSRKCEMADPFFEAVVTHEGATAFERNLRADAAERRSRAIERSSLRPGDLPKIAGAIALWFFFVVLLADGCSQIPTEPDEFRQERQFEEFGY